MMGWSYNTAGEMGHLPWAAPGLTLDPGYTGQVSLRLTA